MVKRPASTENSVTLVAITSEMLSAAVAASEAELIFLLSVVLKRFASAHAEVPLTNDVLYSHDIIDNAERDCAYR